MTTQVTKTFTEAGTSDEVTVPKGSSISYAADVDSAFTTTMQLFLERTLNGQSWNLIAEITGDTTTTYVRDAEGRYRFRTVAKSGPPGVSGTGIVQLTELPTPDFDLVFGAQGEPTSGSIGVEYARNGKFFELTFRLIAARINVTDEGTSGAWGALKLLDFVPQGIHFIACRQNYTAFAEGDDLTGAGDAVFEIGVGSDDIAVGDDGALASDEDDIGGDVNVTMSGGAGTGTIHTASNAVFDGTTTPVDLWLNWSGNAATIDANSTIDVTGTITIVGCFLGDD